LLKPPWKLKLTCYKSNLYQEFVSLEVRKSALGNLRDISEVGLRLMSEKVEKIYGAKKILDNMDWLACHEENGQTYKEFVEKPDRNEVTKDRSKIYLLIADDEIDQEY